VGPSGHFFFVKCRLKEEERVRGMPSIAHGYFQSQFRVQAYKEVDRPTHDSIKRERERERERDVEGDEEEEGGEEEEFARGGGGGGGGE
jgi:hypothetical protein